MEHNASLQMETGRITCRGRRRGSLDDTGKERNYKRSCASQFSLPPTLPSEIWTMISYCWEVIGGRGTGTEKWIRNKTKKCIEERRKWSDDKEVLSWTELWSGEPVGRTVRSNSDGRPGLSCQGPGSTPPRILVPLNVMEYWSEILVLNTNLEVSLSEPTFGPCKCGNNYLTI